MIFVIGSLVELQPPADIATVLLDAQGISARYHHLACGALASRPSIMQDPTISGIRCMVCLLAIISLKSTDLVCSSS